MRGKNIQLEKMKADVYMALTCTATSGKGNEFVFIWTVNDSCGIIFSLR